MSNEPAKTSRRDLLAGAMLVSTPAVGLAGIQQRKRTYELEQMVVDATGSRRDLEQPRRIDLPKHWVTEDKRA